MPNNFKLNLEQVIEYLKQERDRIDRLIASFEKPSGNNSRNFTRTPHKRIMRRNIRHS